jgi:hypothetical protein
MENGVKSLYISHENIETHGVSSKCVTCYHPICTLLPAINILRSTQGRESLNQISIMKTPVKCEGTPPIMTMGPKVRAQPVIVKDVLKSDNEKDHPIKAP